MFVERASWKQLELRQGDILVGIPFPFVSPSEVNLLGRIPAGEHDRFPAISASLQAMRRDPQDISYFTGHVTMKLSPCIVATQCCELRTNQRGQLREVAAIALCRIIPVRQSIMDDAEKLTSLHENRDPRLAARSYKNYFWVGTAEGLSNTDLMADFSQVTCIPANEFPAIMEKKHAQMTDIDRMKLKIKLGVFFAKPTDEELVANIAQDPWNVAAPAVAEVAPPVAAPVEPAANALPIAALPDNPVL